MPFAPSSLLSLMANIVATSKALVTTSVALAPSSVKKAFEILKDRKGQPVARFGPQQARGGEVVSHPSELRDD